VKLVNTTRSRVHQKISSARAAPIIGLAAFSIIAAVVTLPAQADQTAAMAAAPAKNPNGGDPRSARSRLHRFRRAFSVRSLRGLARKRNCSFAQGFYMLPAEAPRESGRSIERSCSCSFGRPRIAPRRMQCASLRDSYQFQKIDDFAQEFARKHC
jgi:hypothetical protein